MILGFLAFAIMGIILGLIGGGGAILTVPILTYLFEFSIHDATLYSLLIVGVTACTSILSTFKTLNKKLVMGYSLFGLIGVAVARRGLLPMIPEVFFIGSYEIKSDSLLIILFGVLLFFVAWRMRKPVRASEAKQINSVQVVVAAFCIGIVSGFFGAGGGFLIVPALVMLVGIPVKEAVKNSLAIIAIQSLGGFAASNDFSSGYYSLRSLLPLLLVILVLSVVGVFVGRKISQQVSPEYVKSIFSIFLVLLGLAMIAFEFKKALLF